jgi:hypothetical protein
MARTATVKTIKVGRTRIDGEPDRAGTATLTPVVGECGETVYLVAVDQRASEYFGGPHGGTIGGIVRARANRWAVVAYRDRKHLTHGGGPVTYLPNAKSQAAAVRGLLRFYHHQERGDVMVEPTQMSKSAQAYLMD